MCGQSREKRGHKNSRHDALCYFVKHAMNRHVCQKRQKAIETFQSEHLRQKKKEKRKKKKKKQKGKEQIIKTC